MSTIAVNAITNAAGGNTATINGTTPTAQSLQGFRNRLINSDMRIDQRNAGASITPTGSVYALDRWRLGLVSSQRMSLQRVSDAPMGFTNSILCTVTTAGSATAGDLIYLQQNIEGFNVSDLGFGTASAQPVTASFWVKSSVTGLKSISLNNGALNRAYCTTYNIDAANTWEYKTVTMPGDTTGTWETGNGNGLELHFNFQVGSTFETALNTWSAGRFYSAASVPDITDVSGATISFTGVQLEAGSVATPFERRPYGTELALCQRYYETGVSVQYIGTSNSYQYSGLVYYKVSKRANATVVGVNEFNQGFPTTFSILDANTQGFTQYRISNATVANGQFGISWNASAEL